MVISNILMDLDDTLLDFHRAEAIALERTLRSMGVTVTPEMTARYSAINDRLWKMLERRELARDQVKLRRFELLFEEYGLPLSGEEARIRYEKFLGQGHYFLPGAEELLRTLAPDYRLYLASNGTAAVQRGRIASAGIGKYFREIFISEEIGADKPAAEFFERCFARIPEFSAEETMILGDSLTSDIRGGNNAGIRTCWFNPKGAANDAGVRVDYEIRELAELPDLLRTLT